MYLNQPASELFGCSGADMVLLLNTGREINWIHPDTVICRALARMEAKRRGLSSFRFRGRYLRHVAAGGLLPVPVSRSIFHATELINTMLGPTGKPRSTTSYFLDVRFTGQPLHPAFDLNVAKRIGTVLLRSPEHFEEAIAALSSSKKSYDISLVDSDAAPELPSWEETTERMREGLDAALREEDDPYLRAALHGSAEAAGPLPSGFAARVDRVTLAVEAAVNGHAARAPSSPTAAASSGRRSASSPAPGSDAPRVVFTPEEVRRVLADASAASLEESNARSRPKRPRFASPASPASDRTVTSTVTAGADASTPSSGGSGRDSEPRDFGGPRPTGPAGLEDPAAPSMQLEDTEEHRSGRQCANCRRRVEEARARARAGERAWPPPAADEAETGGFGAAGGCPGPGHLVGADLEEYVTGGEGLPPGVHPRAGCLRPGDPHHHMGDVHCGPGGTRCPHQAAASAVLRASHGARCLAEQEPCDSASSSSPSSLPAPAAPSSSSSSSSAPPDQPGPQAAFCAAAAQRPMLPGNDGGRMGPSPPTSAVPGSSPPALPPGKVAIIRARDEVPRFLPIYEQALPNPQGFRARLSWPTSVFNLDAEKAPYAEAHRHQQAAAAEAARAQGLAGPSGALSASPRGPIIPCEPPRTYAVQPSWNFVTSVEPLDPVTRVLDLAVSGHDARRSGQVPVSDPRRFAGNMAVHKVSSNIPQIVRVRQEEVRRAREERAEAARAERERAGDASPAILGAAGLLAPTDVLGLDGRFSPGAGSVRDGLSLPPPDDEVAQALGQTALGGRLERAGRAFGIMGYPDDNDDDDDGLSDGMSRLSLRSSSPVPGDADAAAAEGTAAAKAAAAGQPGPLPGTALGYGQLEGRYRFLC